MGRKILWVMLSLLLVVGVVQAQGPDGIGDDYYPDLGNSGYDVQHYTLDLAADVDANTLAGTVTIDALATQDLTSFNLDFVNQFTISEILINDTAAEFSQTDHELTITPAAPLTNGDAFTVAVSYSGEPQPVSNPAIPIPVGWINYENGVYVASEPNGAAGWYPVNDHPLDKATYTFRITVPKPYVVAANGQLHESIDNGDTTTYVWEAADLMASYLVTVDIAEFSELTDEGPNGLPIRHYVPTDLTDEAETAFEHVPDILEFYSSVFGPYPFEAFGLVVADTDFPFALETQTLVLMSRGGISVPEYAEETIAHEMAHQWFGDSVSVAEWRDIWLSEGFATYASWLWVEHTQGSEAMDSYVNGWYESLSGPNSDLMAPGNAPANDLFNIGVYMRGGMTLHALRLQVGDEAFFQILPTYFERFENGNATTADFIAVSEEISGQDLDAFFDSWLHDETMPELPAGNS
jgi:aminopeptidase N